LIGHKENYSYLCAALKGRAARFYKWEELCALARGDFKALESEFLEGRYRESYRSQILSALSSPLRKIELSIMFEVTKRLRTAHSKAEGEPYDLMSVVLSRGDLHNFRVILRRFASNHRIQTEEYLWHLYGNLPRKFYKNIWDSNNIPAAREEIYLFDDPHGMILDKALMVLQNTGNLIKAERDLILSYINYHEGIVSKYQNKNGALVREFLGRLVDLWNINLWLRERANIASKEEGLRYLPGGAWIDPEVLAKAKVITEAVHGTPWRKAVRKGGFKSFQEFQWHLQSEFWTWQVSLFRKDPLGFEVPFGYIAKVLVEWSNLNIIAVGIAFGSHPKKITDRLIPIK